MSVALQRALFTFLGSVLTAAGFLIQAFLASLPQ